MVYPSLKSSHTNNKEDLNHQGGHLHQDLTQVLQGDPHLPQSNPHNKSDNLRLDLITLQGTKEKTDPLLKVEDPPDPLHHKVEDLQDPQSLKVEDPQDPHHPKMEDQLDPHHHLKMSTRDLQQAKIITTTKFTNNKTQNQANQIMLPMKLKSRVKNNQK